MKLKKLLKVMETERYVVYTESLNDDQDWEKWTRGQIKNSKSFMKTYGSNKVEEINSERGWIQIYVTWRK